MRNATSNATGSPHTSTSTELWMPPSRRSSTTTNTTTTSSISSALLPPSSHDDPRENQRRLSLSALHTVSPPSSKLLHTHGHHRSIPPGTQTTPRLVLLLQSSDNRAAIGLACAQATAMKIDIAPHKRRAFAKSPSPRPRPPPLSHPSTRPPLRLVKLLPPRTSRVSRRHRTLKAFDMSNLIIMSGSEGSELGEAYMRKESWHSETSARASDPSRGGWVMTLLCYTHPDSVY